MRTRLAQLLILCSLPFLPSISPLPSTALYPSVEAVVINNAPPVHIAPRHGYVYRRGLVFDSEGFPIFATFDAYGEVITEIGSASGERENAFVLSADEFNAYKTKAYNGKSAGYRLMEKATYEEEIFTTVNNDTVVKPTLKRDTKSLLVMPDRYILVTDEEIVVDEFPIDLVDTYTLQDDTVSALFDKDGKLLQQETDQIGYRSAYLDSKEDYANDSNILRGRENGDNLLEPLHQVIIESSGGGTAVTDSYGHYALYDFYPSCPGFGYSMNSWITAKFQYIAPDPKGGRKAHFIPFSIKAPVSCQGRMEVIYAGSVPVYQLTSQIIAHPRVNIPIDALLLTGVIHLINPYGDPLKVTDEGTETIYTYDDYATVDTRLKDQGLLESINKEDLADTDIYVFRASDDTMIAKQEGLKESDITATSLTSGKHIFFRQLLPGFRDTFFGRTTPKRMQGLRVGEDIRVVIINRPTGYMTSRLIKAEPSSLGSIDINMGRVSLLPPNLKVKVTRIHDWIKRPEVGTWTDYQTIAFEGAGLTSDYMLLVSTNWLDHDGKQLPSSLPGYTARISKSVSSSSLAEKGMDDVETFKVEPNAHLQVVRSPSGSENASQHFYIHVNGEEKDSGNPDFSTLNAGSKALKIRPKHYVPVLVSIPDISKSDAKKEVAKSSIFDAFFDSADGYIPEYAWKYRSEMQYSLYGFKPHEIQPDASILLPGEVQMIDLTKGDSVRYLDGSQVLDVPSLLGLELFDASDRQFTIEIVTKDNSLVTVSIDNQGKATISDPTLLDVFDFISISLFQDNDPENLLWAKVLRCGSCRAESD